MGYHGLHRITGKKARCVFFGEFPGSDYFQAVSLIQESSDNDFRKQDDTRHALIIRDRESGEPYLRASGSVLFLFRLVCLEELLLDVRRYLCVFGEFHAVHGAPVGQ